MRTYALERSARDAVPPRRTRPIPAGAVRALLAIPLAVGVLLVLPPTPTVAQGTWTATSITGAPDAQAYRSAVWTGSTMIVWGGGSYTNTGGVYDPATDTWMATSTTGAPSPRGIHTAVWTGSRMIVWGGPDAGGGAGVTNTGGIYDPVTNIWTPTSTTGAPSPRGAHAAVWTGSRMIIWGGEDSVVGSTNSGGIYDPATDTWTPTSTTGAPTPRSVHRNGMVWTGSRMIVWGGEGATGSTNTGGIYDPATDTWTPTSTTGAPTPRVLHTALWMGSRMIVWGGWASGGATSTGGIYDPATNTWTATATAGATRRVSHSAVWTGTKMIVWGGEGSEAYSNTGEIYDPATNSWNPTGTTAAPVPRKSHAAVWTGSKMIIWGGSVSGGVTNTGGIYDLTPQPTDFYTLTPCRVVDTRNPESATGGPALVAYSTRSFPVTGGVCAVPFTAVAVSVNLTAVGATARGNLTLFAGDVSNAPLVSSINFMPGVTRANNAVVPLASDGSGTLKVKNGSAGAVHFVLDVNGYLQ